MHPPDSAEASPEPEEEKILGQRAPDPSRRWFLWIAGIALVGLVTFVSAKPVYRLVKERRAARMIPQAQAALESGNLAEAGRQVRILIGLAPRRPDVMRLTAQFCSRTGNPDGLNYWNFLLASPEATREDRLAAIDFALTLNRLDLSLPHLRLILATNAVDRDALRLLTRHFRLSGDPMALRSSAREWLNAFPTDNEAEYTLGSALLDATDEATRSEGSRLLWGLTAGGSSWSEAAATRLASKATLTRSESALLLRLLAERPETRLAAERLRLRLHPEDREGIIGAVAALVSPSTPLAELVPVVTWLAEASALDQALALLPTDRAATNAALMSVRIQILLEQKKFEEVQQTLARSGAGTNRVSLAPYVAECLEAMRARHQQEDTDIGPRLESALALAGKDPRALAFVAGYAEYLGAFRTAMNAHLRRLEWPPALLSSSAEAFRLARKIQDEVGIHGAVRRLSEALPGDVGLKALEAYEAALLKLPSLNGRELLVELQRSNPDDLLFRASLALVDLRAGRPIEALSLLEATTVDWKSADARWHAVYVAALSANQQREAARMHARQIDLGKLSPTERQLLEDAR